MRKTTRSPVRNKTFQALKSTDGLFSFGAIPPQWQVKRADGGGDSGALYDPKFKPKGGWDTWAEWAANQGKVGRIVRSIAKNAMAFKVCSDDEKQEEALQVAARRVHLQNRAVEAGTHWLVYGRTFLEPYHEVPDDGEDHPLTLDTLAGIKVLPPATIRTFRDTERDVKDLKAYLERRGTAAEKAYAATLKTGTGDEIIGYAQHWQVVPTPGVTTTFWMPDELIAISRYPSPSYPDGVGILQQNYAVIMNKLGLERDLAIMARRYADPFLVFGIPEEWWDRRAEIIKAIREAREAGQDVYKPVGFELDILETKGNPVGVIRHQEHLEDQLIAGMGFADSFTESTSSNRSVGEIQLQFFERDLAPDRALFAEVLEDELLTPLAEATWGNRAKPVRIEFEDLTPENKIEKARAMAAWAQYMTPSQRQKLLDELGYPLGEGEVPPDPYAAPAPGAGGAPPGADKGQPGSGPEQDRSGPLQEVARALGLTQDQAVRAMFLGAVQDTASQAGVPKPVLQAGSRAREEILEELERWRRDVQAYLEE